MNIEPVRRVNYSPGGSTTNCLNTNSIDADFRNYHVPLWQLMHRALHRRGVVLGLEVGGTGSSTVSVAPGAAIDA